jgi:hypothetical protein
LNEVPGVKLPADATNKRSSCPLSVLSQPGSLEKFFVVFEWFVDEVEKAAGRVTIQSY